MTTITMLLLLLSDYTLFILRVVFGVVFVAHGWPKIRDLRKNAEGFSGMGFRPGMLWGTIVAVLEFLGGLLLIIGVCTRPVAALLFVQFIVVILWKIIRKTPFTKGVDFDLLLAAVALVLLTMGSGFYALDRLWYWP